jgi:UDP-N-acetylmuramoyl-tripeptide--D-alanyl-D-alanine ligase
MMNNSGIILCGKEKSSFDLDVALVSCSQGENGLNIKVSFSSQKDKKETIDLETPLYGPHNGHNVMLAVAAGLELGLELETIKKALKTLRPVSQRLEVVQGVKGPTVIDDTYCANPDGFESALSVLSDLQKPGGRRILVTPGMLDLGSQHDAQHKKLGQIAGKHVDIALVVGAKRMKTFSSAFNSTKEKGAQLRTFEVQKDAEDWIKQNAGNKDIILFEGHLPALYETFIEF